MFEYDNTIDEFRILLVNFLLAVILTSINTKFFQHSYQIDQNTKKWASSLS